MHAVATCDVADAEDRGWTESLCGCRLPVDVALVSELNGDPDRDDLVCRACLVGVLADVSQPPIGHLSGDHADTGEA